MGATYTETVTELVKAMIQSGKVPPVKKNMEPLDEAKSILKRSIVLVRYGREIYNSEEIENAIKQILNKDWAEQEKLKKNGENGHQGKPAKQQSKPTKPETKTVQRPPAKPPRVVNDLNQIDGRKK